MKGLAMRHPGWTLALLLSIAAAACAEPPGEGLYIKFGGGSIYDRAEKIGGREDVTEPVMPLETRDAWVLVELRSGKKGWLRRQELGTRQELLADVSEQIGARPNDAKARLFRAGILAGRGSQQELEQALKDLEQAAQAEPELIDIYLLRGPLLAKSQMWEAAVADYTKVLAKRPDFAPAMRERAVARLAQRDFRGALGDLDRYLAREPRDATAYCIRATAYVELDDYDQAETDFVKALALDNESPLPSFERARMWMRRHEATRAVSDLEETLRRDPEHLSAKIFLATLLACGPDDTPRDGKRAVELATAACEQTNWTDFRALEALAAAQGECGEFTKAVATQEKALAVLEGSPLGEGPRLQAKERLGQYRSDRPVRLVR